MPTGKSVKFEICVKELVVKFEGDIQSAERMHGEVAGALTSLASAQRLLTAPPKPPPTPAIVTVGSAGGRRRSRRRAAVNAGTEAANSDGVAAPESDAGANDEGRQSRRSGAATLITQLKEEQFFNAKRSISEIRQELAKKGHNFQSNEISPVLLSLTQQEVLKRDKDAGLNQWVYFAAA